MDTWKLSLKMQWMCLNVEKLFVSKRFIGKIIDNDTQNVIGTSAIFCAGGRIKEEEDDRRRRRLWSDATLLIAAPPPPPHFSMKLTFKIFAQWTRDPTRARVKKGKNLSGKNYLLFVSCMIIDVMIHHLLSGKFWFINTYFVNTLCYVDARMTIATSASSGV